MIINWQELRKKYPNISIVDFMAIRDAVGSSEVSEKTMVDIHLLLAEGDRGELKKQKEFTELINKKLAEFDASMIHHTLAVHVPDGIDESHLKAYLVYGLLKPAQARTFAGRKTISLGQIRIGVQNKLGVLFDPGKFSQAHEWLSRNGVIMDKKGVSLAPSERNCSKEGRMILKEARRFALGYSKK